MERRSIEDYLLRRRFMNFPRQMIANIIRHLRGEKTEFGKVTIEILWANYKEFFQLGTNDTTDSAVIRRVRESESGIFADILDWFDNSGVSNDEDLQCAKCCIDAVRKYEAELASLGLEELEQRYLEQDEHDTQVERAKAEQEERSRFFNQPAAEVNFEYWRNQHYWNPDEATALSFGKDHRKVNASKLHSLRNKSAFARKYFDRLKIIYRAVEAGDLGQVSERRKFIQWAKKTKVCHFDARLVSSGNTATDTSSKENPKSLRTLGDALLGALLYHYFLAPTAIGSGADTKKGGADAVSMFIANIRKSGIDVNEQTLRKYISQASERAMDQAKQGSKLKLQGKLMLLVEQLSDEKVDRGEK